MKIKKIVKQQAYLNMDCLGLLDRMNAISLEHLPQEAFLENTERLKELIRDGSKPEETLAEAFSLAREAARRVLGLKVFPTQVMAGLALFQGWIAQKQTGEGKTLAAVAPAYVRALEGRGVHILTFNDYLAKRDALWMGPVFSCLGLSVGYIQEGMSQAQRKAAYACDITYVTAREAGFDYLRDSLCMEPDETVHRPFYYAIVDEADSIMIDEARIPLVIAGKYGDEEGQSEKKSYAVARALSKGQHFEVDENNKDIFLTDAGIGRAEALLGSINLYDEIQADRLSSLYNALYVQHLVMRDRDYIVKDGRILLIDGFTGRIAEKRMYPNRIQSFIEIKEGLLAEGKGTILGSIAMQYFLNLYPILSGMTGTATHAHLAEEGKKEPASGVAARKAPIGAPCSEFMTFYGKEVRVIPTFKPCIRVDHPDRIFTHVSEKKKVLVAEIVRVHQTGQPILIGTQSIEESERLAEALTEQGVPCQVLNAKQDEREAAIIADAGRKGAVTVSTNMAGRGVDIRLGGEDEASRDEVVSLGGLYIIGTGRHESVRIDNQLRGRAGRQGEPGESRFFISLEDALLQRFDLTRGFMERFCPEGYRGELSDPLLKREIARCQRLAEGYNSDMRSQVWRYTSIVEQQRKVLFHWRHQFLSGRIRPEMLEKRGPALFQDLCVRYGEAAVRRAEKQLTLALINQHWSEHLDYLEYIKESIHLVVLGGQNLVDAFNRKAVEAFDALQDSLWEDLARTIRESEVTEDGIDLKKAGLLGPASTWTFLLNESSDQFSRIPQMIKAVSKAFTGTLFTFRGLYRKWTDRLAKGKGRQ